MHCPAAGVSLERAAPSQTTAVKRPRARAHSRGCGNTKATVGQRAAPAVDQLWPLSQLLPFLEGLKPALQVALKKQSNVQERSLRGSSHSIACAPAGGACGAASRGSRSSGSSKGPRHKQTKGKGNYTETLASHLRAAAGGGARRCASSVRRGAGSSSHRYKRERASARYWAGAQRGPWGTAARPPRAVWVFCSTSTTECAHAVDGAGCGRFQQNTHRQRRE